MDCDRNCVPDGHAVGVLDAQEEADTKEESDTERDPETVEDTDREPVAVEHRVGEPDALRDCKLDAETLAVDANEEG